MWTNPAAAQIEQLHDKAGTGGGGSSATNRTAWQ